jgi:O-antigen ligase
MPPRPSFDNLTAPLLWALLGLPLCVFAGVTWDAFRPANGAVQFLGASNNLFFLWLTPIALLATVRGLVQAARGHSDNPWFLPLLLALVAWGLLGLWWNGVTASLTDMVLPITALVVLVVGGTLHVHARSVVAQGHVADLHNLTAWSLGATGVGVLFGGVVHMFGPWAEVQPFLHTDGFGNIRTLGETALLGLAVGLAMNARRFALVPFVLAVAMAMILAWSGTRAAWVGLGGVLVVGAVWWAVPVLGVARWLAAIALGAALSIPLPLPDGNYGAFRASAFVEEATTVASDIGAAATKAKDTEASESNRLALWSWGIDRIQEAPLMGRGFAAMGTLPDKPAHANFKHLHNLPLDLMFGFGVPVGLALTLLLAWQGLVAMHRARGTAYILLPMIGCGTLATSLFAGLFLFPISVVAVAIGLAMAARKVHPSVDVPEQQDSHTPS